MSSENGHQVFRLNGGLPVHVQRRPGPAILAAPIRRDSAVPISYWPA